MASAGVDLDGVERHLVVGFHREMGGSHEDVVTCGPVVQGQVGEHGVGRVHDGDGGARLLQVAGGVLGLQCVGEGVGAVPRYVHVDAEGSVSGAFEGGRGGFVVAEGVGHLGIGLVQAARGVGDGGVQEDGGPGGDLDGRLEGHVGSDGVDADRDGVGGAHVPGVVHGVSCHVVGSLVGEGDGAVLREVAGIVAGAHAGPGGVHTAPSEAAGGGVVGGRRGRDGGLRDPRVGRLERGGGAGVVYGDLRRRRGMVPGGVRGLDLELVGSIHEALRGEVGAPRGGPILGGVDGDVPYGEGDGVGADVVRGREVHHGLAAQERGTPHGVGDALDAHVGCVVVDDVEARDRVRGLAAGVVRGLDGVVDLGGVGWDAQGSLVGPAGPRQGDRVGSGSVDELERDVGCDVVDTHVVRGVHGEREVVAGGGCRRFHLLEDRRDVVGHGDGAPSGRVGGVCGPVGDAQLVGEAGGVLGDGQGRGERGVPLVVERPVTRGRGAVGEGELVLEEHVVDTHVVRGVHGEGEVVAGRGGAGLERQGVDLWRYGVLNVLAEALVNLVDAIVGHDDEVKVHGVHGRGEVRLVPVAPRGSLRQVRGAAGDAPVRQLEGVGGGDVLDLSVVGGVGPHAEDPSGGHRFHGGAEGRGDGVRDLKQGGIEGLDVPGSVLCRPRVVHLHGGVGHLHIRRV